MLALCTTENSNVAVDAQVVVPDDYVGGFRLRMYWDEKYNWQESKNERFWCMECDGMCDDGDKMSKLLRVKPFQMLVYLLSLRCRAL